MLTSEVAGPSHASTPVQTRPEINAVHLPEADSSIEDPEFQDSFRPEIPCSTLSLVVPFWCAWDLLLVAQFTFKTCAWHVSPQNPKILNMRPPGAGVFPVWTEKDRVHHRILGLVGDC